MATDTLSPTKVLGGAALESALPFPLGNLASSALGTNKGSTPSNIPSAPQAMEFPVGASGLPSPQTTPTGPTGVASSSLADQTLQTQQNGYGALLSSMNQQADTKKANGGTVNIPNPDVSIVDLLNSKGIPSDYATRAKMASQAGIKDYAGTAAQNAQLIGLVNGGLKPASIPAGGPGSPTDTSKTGDTTPATYETQVNENVKKFQDNADQHIKDIDSIANGTFPLTPAQQSVIDSTKATLDANRAAQLKANTAYENGVLLAGNRLGLNIQNPREFLAESQQAISDDIAKVNALDATAAKTISDLKQGFLDKDYTYINDKYTALQDALGKKQDAIDKIHKDAVDQANALRDYNLKVADLEEKKREFNIQQAALQGGGNTTVPQVQMTGNGTPSKADQSKFLAALPTDLAATIKAIAEYRQNPNSIPSKQYKGAGRLDQAAILSLVNQYDPTYNQTQYATRQAALTNFASGKYSQNVTALKTAVGHISDLSANFAKLHNTSFTPYNFVKNNIDKNIGGGAISRIKENADAVAGELAAVFKASGATDTEIKTWRDTLTPNMSPDQYKQWIEQALDLMGTRLGVLGDQYQSALGKPKDNGFLSDDNAAQLLALKKQGYSFEMPTLSDTPLVRIQAFHDSSPESAAILDAFQQISPNATPQEIIDLLAQEGINLD